MNESMIIYTTGSRMLIFIQIVCFFRLTNESNDEWKDNNYINGQNMTLRHNVNFRFWYFNKKHTMGKKNLRYSKRRKRKRKTSTNAYTMWRWREKNVTLIEEPKKSTMKSFWRLNYTHERLLFTLFICVDSDSPVQ